MPRGKADGLFRCDKCGARKAASDYRIGSSGKRSRYCSGCQDAALAALKAKRESVLAGSDHRRKRALLVVLGKHERTSMQQIKAEAKRHKVERKADALRRRAYMGWLRQCEAMYQAEPEQVEVRREKARLYALAHPDDAVKRRDAYRKRYAENTEKEKQRIVIYKHAHPDKVAKWGDRRKHRAAEQADGSLDHTVVGGMFAARGRCPYCERKLTAQNKSLDHMVPLSRGGSHGIHNVVICCRSCNLRKHDMAFADWIGTLSASCERRARRLYAQRYGTQPEQATMALKYG